MQINHYQTKKLETELLRVTAAKGEMELKIMERQQDIENLQKQIENQNERAKQLTEELKKIKTK